MSETLAAGADGCSAVAAYTHEFPAQAVKHTVSGLVPLKIERSVQKLILVNVA